MQFIQITVDEKINQPDLVKILRAITSNYGVEVVQTGKGLETTQKVFRGQTIIHMFEDREIKDALQIHIVPSVNTKLPELDPETQVVVVPDLMTTLFDNLRRTTTLCELIRNGALENDNQ